MKMNAFMTRGTCTTVTAAMMLMYVGGPDLRANETQTSAYRNSIEQEDIKRDTERARAELLLLIEDFQQNQLSTGELSETKQALDKLASISDKEMQPVIDLLREVSSTSDPREIEKKLIAASESQKNIHILLRKLADNLIIHRNQASMQQRLEQLILRQLTNNRQTKEFTAGGKAEKAEKLRPEQATIYQHCKSEQIALKSEVELAVEAIRQIVNGMPEAGRPGYAEVLKTAESINVISTADRAAMELMQSRWLEALAAQQAVRDGLQKMLMDLRSKQTPAERVAAAKSKLEAMIEEQKRAADQPKDGSPASQKDQRETQKELADKTAALQKEVEAVNAKSAQELAKAKDAMDKADAAIEKSKGTKSEEAKQAEAAQKDAITKMEQAKASLEKQLGDLAKAEQNKQTPTAQQHMENLQNLKNQVDAAAQQQQQQQAQQQQGQKPDPQAQQKAADQAAQLQQQALQTSNEAAKSLGEASTAMQQPGQEQKAQQALQDASKQLEKQLEAAKQAQQLQALASKISEAQAQAQAAGKSIQESKQGPMDTAMKQTDSAQGAVQQAQAQIQQAQGQQPQPNQSAQNQNGQQQPQTPTPGQQLQPGGDQAGKPPTPPGVDQALSKASAELSKSNLEAAQKKQSSAAAANKQAQEALAKASESVNSALAEAMAQAGAPQQPAPGKPQPGQQQKGQQQQQGQQAQQQGDAQPTSDMASGTGMDSQMSKQLGGPLGSSAIPGGNAQVVTGLKPKDREAATLLQKEKAPAEYSGMARQYMKNLAQGETATSGGK